MFDSAATELIKKTLFFLQCSVLRGLGYIFGCPLRSCPVRTQTSHCLPAEALSCCCVVRPVVQTLLFCCVLRHALRQSLSVVVGCLGNGRLRQQRACISMDGLPRQRLAASAMGVYLS